MQYIRRRVLATKSIIGVIVLSLMLSGCQMIPESERCEWQKWGLALASSLASYEVFKRIGSGSGKRLSIISGAALAGLMGYKFGEYLGCTSQKQVGDATQRALSTGQSQSWSNPTEQASGSVQVVESDFFNDTQTVSVASDRVSEVPPLDLINEPYRSNTVVNVRGGPSQNYAKVDQLTPDQVVAVIGKVQGSPWYMIGQGGVATGFVHTSLLKPTQTSVAETDLLNQRPSGVGSIGQSDAQVAGACRTVKQTVRLQDGTSKQEEMRLCQTANGWELS